MRATDTKKHGEKVNNMGYRAESLTVLFDLRKENFKEVEVRFQKLMDSPPPSGYRDASKEVITWREWLYGEASYYEGESKKFVMDDIFNTFGFEYEEDEGNISYIEYPEDSFNRDKINGLLSLFNGLVDEGCFIEWLGQEGDDDRWINYYHKGTWGEYNGILNTKYPELRKLVGGNW